MAAAINSAVRYLSLLLAAGGTLFLLAMSTDAGDSYRSSVARRCGAAGLLALATTILAVPLEGALLLLPPSSGLVDGEVWGKVWRAGAGTTLGLSAAVCAVGLVVLITALAAKARMAGAGAGVAALLAIGSLGLTGHAATAAPRWLTAPAVVAHGLVAAFWLGSLWPLLTLVRRGEPGQAAVALRRFSRLAVVAVAVLIAAGVTIAAVQVEGLRALLTTTYGRLLLLKVGLVAALLLIAGQNKRRHTPALAGGDLMARTRLARNIRAEIGLITAVIAVTAALGHTPPPRAITLDGGHASYGDQAAVTAVVQSRGRRAELTITPGRAGTNVLAVALSDAAGEPLAPLEVTVSLAQPDLGIEPIERPLEPVAAGRYRLATSDFAVPGRWTVRLEVLVTDFEKASFETEIAIGPP